MWYASAFLLGSASIISVALLPSIQSYRIISFKHLESVVYVEASRGPCDQTNVTAIERTHVHQVLNTTRKILCTIDKPT